MNVARRNAGRLLEDARLLLEAGRWPTACSLAVLSIEESGKLSLLRGIATAPNQTELRKAWKEYRDHRAKNRDWIVMDLAAKGARTLDDLRPIFDDESDHPAVLDAVKQIGFYTDCCGNAHWSEPHIVVNEGLARQTVQIAEILLPEHETTPREMEIWIECVGKHWGTPRMFEGLRDFHRRMELEGLSRHKIEDIESFIGAALMPKRTEH